MSNVKCVNLHCTVPYNPGANAIEDERGRVIHLEKFSKEKRAAIAKTLLSSTARARPAAPTVVAAAAAAGEVKTEEGAEKKEEGAQAQAGAGQMSRPLAKKVWLRNRL